jgi:sugar lactone lactonase YvrE
VLIEQVSRVLDLDPNGTLREHDLGVTSYPASSEYASGFPLGAMFLDADGSVFVSRVDSAAITRLNPVSGENQEFPFPPTFGSALELAVVEGLIWITNPYSNFNGLAASTAVIDMATGEFRQAPRLLTGFADRAVDGRLYAADPEAGIIVASIDGRLEDTIELGPARADESGMGLGYEDHLVVDLSRNILWVASGGRTDISRIELASGFVRTYNLPVYLTTLVSCPIGADCTGPFEARLAVGFMAVAANGDLWFAEEGGRRVGLIPASAQ